MMSNLDLELREKHNIPDEKDTVEWCKTEEGRQYLKGGAKYRDPR